QSVVLTIGSVARVPDLAKAGIQSRRNVAVALDQITGELIDIDGVKIVISEITSTARREQVPAALAGVANTRDPAFCKAAFNRCCKDINGRRIEVRIDAQNVRMRAHQAAMRIQACRRERRIRESEGIRLTRPKGEYGRVGCPAEKRGNNIAW